MASAAVHAACEQRDVDLALDLLPAIEPGPAAEAAFANVSCGTQLPLRTRMNTLVIMNNNE